MRVKSLRLTQGWSQEHLSEITNFHRTYIGMIERGERNPSLRNIEKFAIAFDIPLEELFDFTTPKLEQKK